MFKSYNFGIRYKFWYNVFIQDKNEKYSYHGISMEWHLQMRFINKRVSALYYSISTHFIPQLNQKQCVFPKQKKPVKMAKYVYMNFQSSMS